MRRGFHRDWHRNSGGDGPPAHDGNTPNAATRSFADLGETFNDATTRLIGGIDPSNKAAVVKDLQTVQTGIEQLIASDPDMFTGVSAIHAQNIVDQIDLELAAIRSLGTDPFAPKYINDVQRDLIDIVQGDDALAALASEGGKNGFAVVPDLLAPAAPFQGNQEQTAFMRQFAADATEIGNRATALADDGLTPGSDAAVQLADDVRAFVDNANAFTLAQGGIYSARFNNEFASEGVNGTASRALIHGLETGNPGEVRAAAEVIAANAQDVAGNMLGIGDAAPVINNGIPADIDSFAVAGTVFNDATTKLIGGVYSGNQAAVISDLEATREAVQQLLASDPGAFDGPTGVRAQAIVDHLGLEIEAVEAAGGSRYSAAAIRDIHTDVLDIVGADPNLQALANSEGLGGFMPAPETTAPLEPFHANRAQSAFLKQFAADAEALGQEAVTQAANQDAAARAELIDRIMEFAEQADTFVTRQGGLYQAYFTDELGLNGTNGTAARALAGALDAQDVEAAEAAQLVLLENVSNVTADQQAGAGGGRGAGSGRGLAEVHADHGHGHGLGHDTGHWHDHTHDGLLA